MLAGRSLPKGKNIKSNLFKEQQHKERVRPLVLLSPVGQSPPEKTEHHDRAGLDYVPHASPGAPAPAGHTTDEEPTAGSPGLSPF